MKILKDFNNKLCNRTEYVIEFDHSNDKTPKKEDIKKRISELIKNKEDLVSIKGIYTKYGQGISEIHVYSYENQESFKNFEIKNKKNGKKKKTKKQKSK